MNLLRSLWLLVTDPYMWQAKRLDATLEKIRARRNARRAGSPSR